MSTVGEINSLVWMRFVLPCTLGCGLFLTVRTGAVQLRLFPRAVRQAVSSMRCGRASSPGSLSPFQALTTALSSTVGTGNIIGTCQAIAMGGCGAVFWMWVAALLGMAVKYTEIVLAVSYRERGTDGQWRGGPMYYIRNGMGRRWEWLGRLFCLCGMFACLGIGCTAQTNSAADAVINAVTLLCPGAYELRTYISLGCGLVMALLLWWVLKGGMGRTGAVTQRLIPVMSGLYILLCTAVILTHFSAIGDCLRRIVLCAFSPRAAAGACSGMGLRQAAVWGMRRSVFSNEAGLGTSAIAHASSDTVSAAGQGLMGIVEVFIDTVVICSLTALAVLCSGVPIAYGTESGSGLIASALSAVFGQRAAALFVALSMVLFAFSTVTGWSLYGLRCWQFLFASAAEAAYYYLFIAAAVIGAAAPVGLIWGVCDIFNGLMSLPNLIALFALSGAVVRLTAEYDSRSPS